MRFDIISDTHGYLAPELLRELQGADHIVHAGDICSESDYYCLGRIAPVHACLGNNDGGMAYGRDVKRMTSFVADGIRWQVCHYQERLDLKVCDIAICGHSHRPFIERDKYTGTLVMNPGSTTFPRTTMGPTYGRIITEDGEVISAEIVCLELEP